MQKSGKRQYCSVKENIIVGCGKAEGTQQEAEANKIRKIIVLSFFQSNVRKDGRIYRLSIGFPTHRKINFTANMPSPLKWTESFAFTRFQPTLCIRQGIYSVAGDDSHRTHVE